MLPAADEEKNDEEVERLLRRDVRSEIEVMRHEAAERHSRAVEWDENGTIRALSLCDLLAASSSVFAHVAQGQRVGR